MAQLVARSVRDAEVVGSSPITLTISCYNNSMSGKSLRKKSILLVSVLVFGLLTSYFPSTSVSAMSDEKSGAISQHCGTIKQALKSLQKTDARSRSYLGTVYETIISKYITPFNTRLINNGQPNVSLTDLHSTILDVRKQFVSDYTSYSQTFETLLSVNCQEDPEGFYWYLGETRKKRAEVSSDTTNMRNLLSEYLTVVRRLKSNTMDGTSDGNDTNE